MSGGEGPSSEFKPPEHTQPGWEGYRAAGEQLASRPYQQYQGMRVAPMNDTQMTAGQLLRDKMMYSDPQTQAARASLMSISQGGGQNPFMDNAYTDRMISDTAGNMASAHATGTAAQNDALAARSGAYGGSAHTQKQSMDAQGLAQAVGQMGTATRQQDITRKGNLWNTGIDQAMQASGMALPFAQNDLTEIMAGMGFGDKERGYMGELLGEGVNEFNRQQNHPIQNLDLLGNVLGRASTGYGMNTQPGQSGGMNAAGGLLGLLGMLGQQ
jgi:hypothetical protein